VFVCLCAAVYGVTNNNNNNNNNKFSTEVKNTSWGKFFRMLFDRFSIKRVSTKQKISNACFKYNTSLTLERQCDHSQSASAEINLTSAAFLRRPREVSTKWERYLSVRLTLLSVLSVYQVDLQHKKQPTCNSLKLHSAAHEAPYELLVLFSPQQSRRTFHIHCKSRRGPSCGSSFLRSSESWTQSSPYATDIGRIIGSFRSKLHYLDLLWICCTMCYRLIVDLLRICCWFVVQ